MQNVSFLNIDYSVGGGVERVTSDLIDLFKQNGLQVSHMYTLFKSNNQPAVHFDENLVVNIVGPLKSEHHIQAFGEQLKTDHIDVLIYQSDNMSFSLAIQKAARIANVKAIAHYHGTPYAYLRKYPDARSNNVLKALFSYIVYPFKKRKLNRFLSDAQDGIVCVSQAVKGELHQLFPPLEIPIYAILNPQRLEPVVECQEKKNIISLVSRLESRHKNTFLAVKAWATIAHQYPDWRMRFLGIGSLELQMKDYFAEHKITNVDFMGFQENIFDYLAESKIGISTSNCEGFSMAVLEYIATGNAVITTDSDGGVHDMIIPGETGVVVPRNNAEELAQAIELLINNLAQREKLVQQSATHLSKLYEEDTFKKWKDVLS